MERKFIELVTTFEFSYFQIPLFTTSKYSLYPGKFMEFFDILQRLRNNFWKLVSSVARSHFPFYDEVVQIILFPDVCRHCICNDSHNKFY